MSARIETGTIEHEGRSYTALGSVVDHDRGVVIGYVKGATLTTWDGKTVIGTLRRVSTWMVRSGYSASMSSYRATIDGREYHGRGFGEGMSLSLRACKAKVAS